MTRTEALCRVLGWQGGTIHQVAKEIGCSTHDILYGEPISQSTDYVGGWFAARTCSLEHNRKVNFPAARGNLQFWLGASHGFALGQ